MNVFSQSECVVRTVILAAIVPGSSASVRRIEPLEIIVREIIPRCHVFAVRTGYKSDFLDMIQRMDSVHRTLCIDQVMRQSLYLENIDG